MSMHSIADRLMAACEASLSQQRFAHVARVVTLARELARRYGVEEGAAYLAAAAHDLDREMSPGGLLAMVADRRLTVSAAERHAPVLLHGPVSAWRLRCRYGVDRPDILEAVRHHTLGDAGLGAVFRVLYVADYCEPGRRHLDATSRKTILAPDTLEEVMGRCVAHALRRFDRPAAATRRLLRELQEQGVL